MLCYVTLCYVMLCYVTLCYVMLCYVMLCYVMLCYVMSCHVMSCHVMSYLHLLTLLAQPILSYFCSTQSFISLTSHYILHFPSSLQPQLHLSKYRIISYFPHHFSTPSRSMITESSAAKSENAALRAELVALKQQNALIAVTHSESLTEEREARERSEQAQVALQKRLVSVMSVLEPPVP
jgi:hypothetical protein